MANNALLFAYECFSIFMYINFQPEETLSSNFKMMVEKDKSMVEGLFDESHDSDSKFLPYT